jgi:uncharacterized repeat protein (TIGR03803 family)
VKPSICSLFLVAIFVVSSSAQTFTILHTFGGTPDGGGPSSLIRDRAGSLYGETHGGGAFNKGSIFKVTPAGHEALIYSFGVLPDGAFPSGGLIADANGNFYGTTTEGGAFGGPFGNGTVFKIDANGNETVLYSFAGGDDGVAPSGRLLRDAAGNLYGTTLSGAGSCNCGIVFKLDTAGVETVLYRFTDQPDGARPNGVLIGDSGGNLYGTTFYGGNSGSTCIDGCGTIFKLDAQGVETVLYRFGSRPGDGTQPAATLIRDSAGNLYGTTFFGGNRNGAISQGMGTVFKFDPFGHETVLYSFKGISVGDGNSPADIVRDSLGNFYGVTGGGGAPAGKHHQRGTVFKLDTAGVETILHTFTGAQDGDSPVGLVLDSAGTLYGSTLLGGAGSVGVVFKLTP